MTTKKRISRVFAVALAMVLMMALVAVPSFAAQCVSSGNVGYGLNVYGNNQVSPNRNVCMWTTQNTPAQQWYYEWCNDGRNRMKSGIDKSYALNIYRYTDNLYNCDIMKWADNLNDSGVYRSTGSTGGAYTVEHTAYNGYFLTANSFSNGADARWKYGPSSNHTWYFW